jgi:hypothetical protein
MRTVELREQGQNAGLFGDGRRATAAAWASRLLQESEGIPTPAKAPHKISERDPSSAGGEGAPEDVARKMLVDDLHEAIDRTGEDPSRHRDAIQAHDALMEHDGVDRETYSRAGVGGGGGTTDSRESRDWADRLLGPSLLESRCKTRRWGG